MPQQETQAQAYVQQPQVSAPQAAPPIQNTIPAPKAAPAASTPPASNLITDGTVSTAYYFFMMLVYALPLVGLIVCIVNLCSSDNRSKKNYAKAMLIWMIVAVGLSIIMAIVVALGINAYISRIGVGNWFDILGSLG